MTVQCVVIMIILLAISIVFLRAKRYKWALSTFPLMIVPLANVAISQASKIFNYQYTDMVHLWTNLIAVLLSSAWVVLMAFFFERKSQKFSYLIIALAFNIILALILINYSN